MVESLSDERVREEDRIEEERLANHQRQTEKGSTATLTKHVGENLFQRSTIPRRKLQLFTRWRCNPFSASYNFSFYLIDNTISSLLFAPKHQPSWAFWNSQPQKEDSESQSSANTEGEPPAP